MNVVDNDHSHVNAERPVTDWAHPRIYTIAIGLCAWFVLAAWSGFAGGGLVDYLLVIVGGLIFVATALQLILFSVGRSDQPRQDKAKEPSLHDWTTWDYDTLTGRLPGAQAALQILLPIAAAAVGMTLIGIIFRFAA